MHPQRNAFWRWYERHERLHLTVATSLFLLQILHLVWMAGHVVIYRLTGIDLFPTSHESSFLLALVDYTEIPALLSVSLVYLHDLTKRFSWKTVWFLLVLNVQWLHLFWITDEFVIAVLHVGGEGTVLPLWLAWVAIMIDFLEVPVMVDTVRKLVRSSRITN